MNKIRAWHFTGDKLRDGRAIPAVGKVLVFDGKPIICEQGLHASRQPFDALKFAPGHMLHMVECWGDVQEQSDKLVCTHRKIIKSMDATDLLWYFSRMQAVSVVHLWDAPDVVLDYLITGDESLRAAARDAARDAAWAAARDAARDAAWAAAWAAARAAIWAAARDAARDAAWAAAWDVAWAVARDAAWAAAWAAARDAARDAAWAAAWDVARQDFNALVYESFGVKQ